MSAIGAGHGGDERGRRVRDGFLVQRAHGPAAPAQVARRPARRRLSRRSAARRRVRRRRVRLRERLRRRLERARVRARQPPERDGGLRADRGRRVRDPGEDLTRHGAFGGGALERAERTVALFVFGFRVKRVYVLFARLVPRRVASFARGRSRDVGGGRGTSSRVRNEGARLRLGLVFVHARLALLGHVHQRAERVHRRGARVRRRVAQQRRDGFRRAARERLRLRVARVLPQLAEAQAQPAHEQGRAARPDGRGVRQPLQTNPRDAARRARRLSLGVSVAHGAQHKRRHRPLLARRVRRVQEPREVRVPAVLHQVGLARRVQRENFRPDEDENLPQIRRGGLQQLEHVRKYAHGQREVHRPRAHVQEPPQQNQRAQAVRLAQQHLEHDRKLFRRRFLGAPALEPHLERGELLGEERRGRELDGGAVPAPGAVVAVQQAGHLQQARLHGGVPGVPHGVLVRGGHRGARHGRAVGRAHHALGEQKVPEERRDQKVLSEQPLEQRSRQRVPRDGVRHRGEDPVQFPEGRLAVVLLAGDLVDERRVHPVAPQHRARAEPTQRDLDRGGQTRREDIRGKLSALRQRLVRAASRQQNHLGHTRAERHGAAQRRVRARRHGGDAERVATRGVPRESFDAASFDAASRARSVHARSARAVARDPRRLFRRRAVRRRVRGGLRRRFRQSPPLRELQERVYEHSGASAVEDVYGRVPSPALQVVHRERYVLRVALVENPDLAVGRRPRHAVAVVV